MKLKDCHILEERADKYFLNCDQEARPYTISGLATALGLTRVELISIPKVRSRKFLTTAIGRCETFAEERLLDGKNLTGVMFSLKNNFSWREKIEPGESSIEIIVNQPEARKKPDNPDPA